jgi:CRP-like cAMP-binding protein
MARSPRTHGTSLSVDELLGDAPWFAELDEPTRRQVRSATSERAIAQGDMLGRYGAVQTFWFGILEGLIKWSITGRDGRTVTLGGMSVGSWFGEGTLIRNAPRRSDVIALRDSRVAQIPADTFHWLRHHRPAFNDFLLRQVNERLHWFMGNVETRGLLDTDGQIARALLGLVHPLMNPRGERHLQLSQEELANLAAMSRQCCNSALMHLKEAGLVRSEYGGVVVLDLPGLQKMVDR